MHLLFDAMNYFKNTEKISFNASKEITQEVFLSKNGKKKAE